MIVGIEPDYSHEDTIRNQWRMYMAEPFEIKSSSKGLKLGTKKMITLPTHYNVIDMYVTAERGVGLYDANGCFVANIKDVDNVNSDVTTYGPWKGYNPMTQTITFPVDCPDGEYSLRVIFRESGYDDWCMPFCTGGSQNNLVYVKVENSLVYFNVVPTGIDAIRPDASEHSNDAEQFYDGDSSMSSAAFNLSGQRVTSSYRGIVIKGGKKYIR